MANADSTALPFNHTESRIDLLERRVSQAYATLQSLLAAMDDDCPVVPGIIHNTVWAAAELLDV